MNEDRRSLIVSTLLLSLLTAALLLLARNTGLLPPEPMAAPGPGLEAALLVIACLAGGAAGLLSGSVGRLILIALAGIAGIATLALVLFLQNVWIPVFPMTSGCTASAVLVTAYVAQRTHRQRRELMEMLDVQVSPAVASEIWQRRDELLSSGALTPQRLTATVMFVHLQASTRELDQRPAGLLLDWLNSFLSIATETILEHGGMVDDCFGDGIKANFGVPLKRTTDEEIAADAAAAVRCARTLTRRLAATTRDGAQPYVVRFGIHTGEVIAGTAGSRPRSRYTTIGDTVNIAARLEITARDLDLAEVPTRNRIVASDTTIARVGNGDTWHKLGVIHLKGRTERVSAYVLHLEDLEWHIGDNVRRIHLQHGT